MQLHNLTKSLVLISLVTLFACGGSSDKETAESQQDSLDMILGVKADDYAIEEVEEETPKVPQIEGIYLDMVNKLAAPVKWIEEEDPNSYFSVTLDGEGYYRVRGLTAWEGTYIKEVSIPDPESGNTFITFANDENDIEDCFELYAVGGRAYATYYEQCARAVDRVIYINPDYAEEADESSTEVSTMMLKFISIAIVSGEFYMIMEDTAGETVGFTAIGIDDFDMSDNPYFESFESEESIFPQYKLKDGVEGTFYKVSVSVEPYDIGNEEPEMVNVMVGIEESN